MGRSGHSHHRPVCRYREQAVDLATATGQVLPPPIPDTDSRRKMNQTMTSDRSTDEPSLTDEARRFVHEHAFVLATCVAAVGLAYVFALSSKALSIDEELVLASDQALWPIQLGPIEMGRPVISLVHGVLVSAAVQPGLDMAMALLFLLVSAVLWAVLFSRAAGHGAIPKAAVLVFMIVFTTLPVHAYMLAFDTINVAVALGYVWAALAAWSSWRWVAERRDRRSGLAAIAFAVLAVLTYQALVMAVFAGVLIAQLMSILAGGSTRQERWHVALRVSLKLTAPAIAAVAIGAVVSIPVAARGEFAASMVGWGRDDIAASFSWLLQPIIWAIGRGFHGGWVLVPTVAAAAYLVLLLIRRGARTGSWYPMLLLLAIIASQFALTAALGSRLPVRTMLVVPLVAGSMWPLLGLALPWKESLSKAMITAALLFAVWNANSVTQLFMTEHAVFERDRTIAAQIAERLANEGWDGSEVPIVSLGDRELQPVELVASEETFGLSFFNFYQGQRTSFFMRAIGYPFSYPSPEQIDAAIVRGWAMPSWPSAGSVIFEDGVAIVRFSEPEER